MTAIASAPSPHPRSSPRHPSPRRAEWLCLLLILSSALGFRLYGLDAEGLWLDEFHSLFRATAPSLGDLLQDVGADARSPLYDLVLRGWIGIAGTAEPALRLPGMLAGFLALPALWAFGRKAAGPGAALIATALAAGHQTLLDHGLEARSYGFTHLTAVLALWCAWRGFFSPTPNRMAALGFGLLSALGLWWHYYMLFLPLGVGLAILLRADLNRETILRLVLAGFACVVGFLPWLPIALEQILEGQGASGMIADWWLRRSPPTHLHNGLKLYALESLPALILALPVLILGALRQRRSSALPWLLGCCALVPLLATWLPGLFGLPLFFEKYLQFAIPAVMLLLGWALDRILPRSVPPATAGLCSLSLALLILLLERGWLQQTRNDRIRDMILQVTAVDQANGGPEPLVILCAHAGLPMADYYFTRLQSRLRTTHLACDAAGLPPVLPADRALWLLRIRESFDDATLASLRQNRPRLFRLRDQGGSAAWPRLDAELRGPLSPTGRD